LFFVYFYRFIYSHNYAPATASVSLMVHRLAMRYANWNGRLALAGHKPGDLPQRGEGGSDRKR